MTIPDPQAVTVLGATGSIGVSALDVIGRYPERFRVFALTAHDNDELLYEQCRRFQPARAVLGEDDRAARLRRRLQADGLATQVDSGPRALEEVAAAGEVQTVVAGIVGTAGLAPGLAAVRAGKRVLLANKEALVTAGAVFMQAVEESGAKLLPLDSEHNAIFQCLPADFHRGELAASGVRRILLTASGGPFRDADPATLHAVTPDQACAHPNWSMGRKISVDSATMMNKGLELVEACWLFGLQPDDVQVVVHPQSIIHSLVEYLDGSVIAQMGNPDMRIPIAHALSYPERIASGAQPLDLFQLGRLDFQPPDLERFPCLGLAQDAMKAGGNACATLNAANEIAVAAFLDERIGFMDIPRLLAAVMEQLPSVAVSSLDGVLAADQHSRRVTRDLVKRFEAGRRT
ncbi:1-deoxy-D-xylulose-5-phosphate reductoisomerase [Natronocella acetinitrilica]|uniref:1-deoxy-D-xylulose 5-phosphate reductoisomerase n=1 Tax=Natronocella acetinitrilica TaxID=414046 RepID=A0AAE3G998_9GAMM|nr:1-deoxy-D-xylulose-5-phosphate reductoisomerase [Natronocella acetinitrilica]MCP1676152.1 1-deoxy-D-xylulose-5-phosphate reductoisomerase [Natronocella acetinitrilica]